MAEGVKDWGAAGQAQARGRPHCLGQEETMSNEAHDRCATCGDHSPAVRRPRILAALLPIAWAFILFFGACLAILVPLNLILIPCWLMVGSSLGPLARELLDPHCGA